MAFMNRFLYDCRVYFDKFCLAPAPYLIGTGSLNFLCAGTGSHTPWPRDFMLDFCSIVEEWASSGGSRVPDTKVDYMLQVIIPLALKELEPVHDVVNGNQQKPVPLPKSAKEIHDVINRASNCQEPEFVSVEVCRQCHQARNGATHCSNCPKKRVASRLEAIADWGHESVMIWQLSDILQGWLDDAEIAPKLLNHLAIQRDAANGSKHNSLLSERASFYRDLLNYYSSNEPRSCMMLYHSDGFNPLRSRPNSFSLTYGIVKVMCGPTCSHMRDTAQVSTSPLCSLGTGSSCDVWESLHMPGNRFPLHS